MNLRMFKTLFFKIGHHMMHRCMCGRKTERAGIGHYAGVQTFGYRDIHFVAVARTHNEINFLYPFINGILFIQSEFHYIQTILIPKRVIIKIRKLIINNGVFIQLSRAFLFG